MEEEIMEGPGPGEVGQVEPSKFEVSLEDMNKLTNFSQLIEASRSTGILDPARALREVLLLLQEIIKPV